MQFTNTFQRDLKQILTRNNDSKSEPATLDEMLDSFDQKPEHPKHVITFVDAFSDLQRHFRWIDRLKKKGITFYDEVKFDKRESLDTSGRLFLLYYHEENEIFDLKYEIFLDLIENHPKAIFMIIKTLNKPSEDSQSSHIKEYNCRTLIQGDFFYNECVQPAGNKNSNLQK